MTIDCDYIDGYNDGKKEGAIEALKKVKEKIQDFAYFDTNYCGFVLPEWKVSDLIYDYIQELKGDSNDRT
jgi:hypothetical protein